MSPFGVETIILLSIFGILVLFAGFLVGFSFNNVNFKYSMTRDFPSELIDKSTKNVFPLRLGLYLYVLSGFIPLFLLLTNMPSYEGIFTFSLFVIVINVFVALLTLFIFFIPIFYVKQHAILSTVFMSVSLLANALTSYYGFFIYFLNQKYSVATPGDIVYGSVLALIAILEAILIFSPRLKDWAKLQNEGKDNNGWTRPKFFPLAYTEWAFILLNCLGAILLIFILIKI